MGSKGRSRQKKDDQNPKRRKRDDDLSEDMDDEIDAFHKQRDIIPLNVDGDVDASDEDDEHPVLNIEDVDEEDDDDDDDDDTRHTGLAAKIVRQQKFLRQKFPGVDDETHDDEDEEEEKKVAWSGRKDMYYNPDNLQSSDDELAAEEEAEGLRLQRERAKSQSMRDVGLEDSDQEGSDSDRERTLEDVLPKTKTVSKPHEDKEAEDDMGASYEEVKKDLNALSREEQMDVVYNSAPELVGLLSELNDALDQLESKVNPLLSKVKDRNDTTKEGTHYLEVKQILLLSYCQAISFYLLLKSEGHPVRDHPVIARIVEIKSLLDKTKQLDDFLPSGIEDILDQDQGTESGTSLSKVVLSSEPSSKVKDILPVSTKTLDASLLQPRDTVMVTKVDLSKEHMNKQEKRKRQDDQVGLQSMEMLRLRASLEEKLKRKGSFGAPAKPERTENHLVKLVNRKLETLDDFADEANDKEEGAGHKSLSQLVRTKRNKPKVISGDDDLPKRDDIGERRRKHELRVLATAGVKSTEEIGEEDEDEDKNVRVMGIETMDENVEEDGETEESEDEFYKQVKQQRAAKLSAKAELNPRKPVIPSSEETEDVDGKRGITYQIEKNRGLTRSRKKSIKNPRKKYKLKHQKAVVRRKGQVRDIKKPTGPSYGGEASGINTGISRSVRFKN